MTKTDLHQLLLTHGGDCISPQPAHVLRFFRRAPPELWTDSVELCEMAPSACHTNVAELWLEGACDIATGYGLSEDGMWRPHSWGFAGDILETTEVRTKYFGSWLRGPLALRFACDALGFKRVFGKAYPGFKKWDSAKTS